MALFIPVLVGVALVAMTGGGVGTGAVAAKKTLSARERRAQAEGRLREAVEEMRCATEPTHEALDALHVLKHDVVNGPVRNLVELLRASGRTAEAGEFEALDELTENIPDPDMPAVENLLSDVLGSVGSSFMLTTALTQGTRYLLFRFGVASSGTAIRTLSGAAAADAAQAALGGGSLAAGGGGMALGGVMMTGIGIAPSVLITGLCLLRCADSYETSVVEFEAKVGQSVEQIRHFTESQPILLRRINEMHDALQVLALLLDDRVEDLWERDLDQPDSLRDFAIAMSLAKLVMRLVRVPLFADDMETSAEALNALARARDWVSDEVSDEDQGSR